jgi:hypothetical protein
MHRLLLVIIVANLLTSPLVPDRFAMATPADQPLTLGVNMHPLQDPYGPEVIADDIERAHHLHAQVIRINIHWAWIEPQQPGRATWNMEQVQKLERFLQYARQYRIKVLATVLEAPCAWASTAPSGCATENAWSYAPSNPQAYATFVGELVRSYKDDIYAWEIWNEPNLPQFWKQPNPESYAQLLQLTYPIIKANDPHAIVVGGALAPTNVTTETPLSTAAYAHRLYQAGAQQFFDVLSFHPYTDGNPPTWYDDRWPAQSFVRSIPALRAVMEHYGDTRPMWLTEVGWTTVPANQCHDCWTPDLPVSEAEQATYLNDSIQLVRQWPYVDQVLVYQLHDPRRPPELPTGTTGFSLESFYGLYRADSTRKPAATIFQRQAAGRVFLPMVAVTPDGPFRPHQATSIGDGVFTHVTFSDGRAPYSDSWLLQTHTAIQRIRREERPSGCDQAQWSTALIWVGVAAPAQMTVNGVSVGSITTISPQQQHGYIVQLSRSLQIQDTICITPLPPAGFQIILGPDMFYHYDSYCYREHCASTSVQSQRLNALTRISTR